MFRKKTPAPVSEHEIVDFLREHKGQIFSKSEIATGIAENRVPQFKLGRKAAVESVATTIEAQLQEMRLRELQKVARICPHEA